MWVDLRENRDTKTDVPGLKLVAPWENKPLIPNM